MGTSILTSDSMCTLQTTLAAYCKRRIHFFFYRGFTTTRGRDFSCWTLKGSGLPRPTPVVDIKNRYWSKCICGKKLYPCGNFLVQNGLYFVLVSEQAVTENTRH